MKSKRSWVKVNSKTGQTVKHGLCNKCRKDKLEGDKQYKAGEEKRRQDFEAESIDSEAENNWAGLLEQIQNYRKSHGFKFGKISQDTYEKLVAELWWLEQMMNNLRYENWAYPREIKGELIAEYNSDND